MNCPVKKLEIYGVLNCAARSIHVRRIAPRNRRNAAVCKPIVLSIQTVDRAVGQSKYSSWAKAIISRRPPCALCFGIFWML